MLSVVVFFPFDPALRREVVFLLRSDTLALSGPSRPLSSPFFRSAAESHLHGLRRYHGCNASNGLGEGGGGGLYTNFTHGYCILLGRLAYDFWLTANTEGDYL